MTDSNSFDPKIKPTKETYEQLQYAYERLNTQLFSGDLPNALITLQRRRRTYGFFAANRFLKEDGTATDEIALNPAHFRDRPLSEVLATLAHEMVHLWQQHFGTPGRGRYHNKEWAEKMKQVGLQPTDTGEEGGKETGDKVHHIIAPKGPFDRTVKRLEARGFTLTWMENPRLEAAAEGTEEEKAPKEKSKSGKRVRYDCPEAHIDEKGSETVFKAWAKHDAKLLCGEHMCAMVAHDPDG